jgi:hypothetical protein
MDEKDFDPYTEHRNDQFTGYLRDLLYHCSVIKRAAMEYGFSDHESMAFAVIFYQNAIVGNSIIDDDFDEFEG